MGLGDRMRNALGGGGPSRLPVQATTKQIEKHKKAQAREAAASKGRSQRHKEGLRKNGTDARWQF